MSVNQFKIIMATALFCCMSSTISANYFDPLRAIDSREERLLGAKRIYFENRMGRNSTEVPAAYAELIKIADEKNDPGLEAFAELIIGAYYSAPAFLALQKAQEHFEKALAIAGKKDLPDIEAEVYHQMGWFYYWQKKYTFAFEYFLKANNLIQKIGYGSYFFVSKNLYDLGFMYFDFTNYKKAKEYLLESLKYPIVTEWYAIDNYNTLGLVYRDMAMDDSAVYYFKKAIDVASKCKDTTWVGLATGNLAYMYQRQKKYDEALRMFAIDYEMSKKNRDYNSTATVLNSLVLIYTRLNKFDTAAAYMKELDTIIRKVDQSVAPWQYFLLKARLSARGRDFINAYGYLDSATRYRDQLIQRNDTRVITQAEQKIEVEKHLADIKLLESERNKQVLLRNAIIIGAILLLIIAIQVFLRMRAAHKRNIEILNNAKSQLQHYIASIREKNQLIDDFRVEIARLNSIPDATGQSEKEEIIEKLQNATILTDDDWDEFRRLFEKVHKDFFIKLKVKYPDLTNAEMRLLALTKLSLSRKEMAEMLGISPDSIKKTRQRINKKLNLSEEETLDQLVWNL
jgi:tetratricopeptide (TPR) repeat protein